MNKILSYFQTKVIAKLKDFYQRRAVIYSDVSRSLMRLSLREQILFIKQLSIIIRSGIPLLTALNMVNEQSKSKTMKKIIDQVIKDVENGQYLATTLAKFNKCFGELTINIIAIGEISGNLSGNLEHIAVSLKKRRALRSKVISAAVYPIFVILATIAITVMLTVFVFPRVIPVFKSVNYDLPWTTKLLIFISDTIKNHGFLIVAGIIFIFIAIFLLLKIKKVHFWFDKISLSIPFLSSLIQTYNTTSICRTVGLLLNSGTGVVRSFQITSNTTTNLVYKKDLNIIAEKLTKGERISAHIRNHKLFPAMVPQMLAVAENTGKLSETFLYLSDSYEEEMDELTKNLSTTVEPLLLIFMGILVGFIAVSIITPIYGITQHLTPR